MRLYLSRIRRYRTDISIFLMSTEPNAIPLVSDIPPVIVSLTSSQASLSTLATCIKSLLAQDYGNFQIELWLSEEEFPFKDGEIPLDVLALAEHPEFEIHWCKADLGAHNSYFYSMQRCPDIPIIIVNDGMRYDPKMISTLMESYKKFPDCLSCNVAHIMQFKNSGEFSKYENWPMNYTLLNNRPSLRLLPAGEGGVLYPPHILPKEVFDADAIRRTCLHAADLWLKMMASARGVRVVRPKNACSVERIKYAQEMDLRQENGTKGDYNLQLAAVCKHMENIGSGLANPSAFIRNDIF